MLNGSPRRVAIVAAKRIPFTRSNTVYAELGNLQLLTAVLQGLVERAHLQGMRLGEVVVGAVKRHARDWNLVREAALLTELDPATPAYDLQQACGTGLEAAILAANKIALGQIDAGIACGSDTTSDAPMGVNPGLRKQLIRVNAARTTGARSGQPRTAQSRPHHSRTTASGGAAHRADDGGTPRSRRTAGVSTDARKTKSLSPATRTCSAPMTRAFSTTW